MKLYYRARPDTYSESDYSDLTSVYIVEIDELSENDDIADSTNYTKKSAICLNHYMHTIYKKTSYGMPKYVTLSIYSRLQNGKTAMALIKMSINSQHVGDNN